jgi:hypothetical protein
MKTQKFKKLALIGFAIVAVSAYAQFQDSTTGTNALRGVPVIQQKYLPAQPTPVVNNITQVTQVVQPNTYQASGSGEGNTTAAAWANCGGGTLLGGGGSCTDNLGLVAVGSSEPSGNSWVVGCQSLNYNYVYATAYAVCSAN